MGGQAACKQDRCLIPIYHRVMIFFCTGLHVTPAHDDTISMTSITSGASRHLSSAASQVTTQETWTPYKEKNKENMGSMSSLPSYNEAIIYDSFFK